MDSQCALCLEQRPLSNSHVIPEFMYSEMYDEKHRFHVLSTKTPEKPRMQQKGIRERLLCEECETGLSEVERYASLVFSGAIAIETARDGSLVFVSGLDYNKFRLFALSILWRAHASKHRFFREVDLGPHAPKLHRMIQNMDPGSPNEFGFFLSPLVLGEKEITDLIVEPTKSRVDNHRCYRFVFGGVIWAFVVSSHQLRGTVREAFLQPTGTMVMLVSDLREVKFLRDTMEKALKKRAENAF